MKLYTSKEDKVVGPHYRREMEKNEQLSPSKKGEIKWVLEAQ
jgi:hypothetical protein